MTQSNDSQKRSQRRKPGRLRGLVWKALLILCLLGGVYYLLRDGGTTASNGTTFVVRKGPLEITVLEGGSIEALESVELKSEVKGETKILSIVDEGYFITEEDVKNGLVLVELETTRLVDEQVQQELEYQNASATYTEAREQYEIQRNQNESDIQRAILDVKFARMDFEKYLGADVAQEIVRVLGLDAVEGAIMNLDTSSELAVASDPAAQAVEVAPYRRPPIDLTVYADPNRLGNGEAGQRLRKLEDDLVLAEKEVGLAQSKLQGTQRLFDKEFVTRDELENDEMALRRNEIALESARTSKELFIKYEFPKTAEKLLSDYEEALRKLERTRKQAVSQMAQAEAKLKSAEARFTLQTQRRKEIQEQIEKCVIRTTTPGLVVYGARERRYWDEEKIEEGASVRERQAIITIPNTIQMTAKVKIHEAYIERVAKGQKARIKVDAHPDRPLTGEVLRIGVLPDAQNRWMNPDLKVYDTTVTIDGTQDWLKPGLSAQVEILIDRLEDVLYVPLQAVSEEEGKRVCYVVTGGAPERRVVETGAFNDAFIEIKSGVNEGERLLLRAPTAGPEESKPEAEDSKQRPNRQKPAGPANAEANAS